MRESRPTSVSRGFALALFAIVLAFLNAACDSGIADRIRADLWLIDSSDGSIYRIVEDEQGRREEYLLCTDKGAEKFLAMTKDDFQNWLEQFRKRCSCN